MENHPFLHLLVKPETMAEISQGNSNKADGKVRAKKLSTKIDMTPMVDLAFLLLTFFILTSTFNQAKVLDLEMPEPTNDPPPVSHKKILNLVLAGNDKVYWWMGFEPSAQPTNYSKNGLRKILLERKRTVPGLRVLIKAADDARYQNMVDMLDEIAITKIPWYAIVDFTDEDKTRIPAKADWSVQLHAP